MLKTLRPASQRGTISTTIQRNDSSPFARGLHAWYAAGHRMSNGSVVWRDLSINSYDLTLQNAASIDYAGAWKSKRRGVMPVYMNQIDQTVQTWWEGEDNALNVNGWQCITWSMWVNWNNTANNNPSTPYDEVVITRARSYQGTFGFMRNRGDHLTKAYIYTSMGLHADFSSTTLDDDTWYLTTVVYDGVNLITYIDGVNIHEMAVTGGQPLSLADTSTSLIVGSGSWGGSADNKVGASFDDIRVYNRPLAASEVMKLYRETRGGGYGSLASPSRLRLASVGAATSAQTGKSFLLFID